MPSALHLVAALPAFHGRIRRSPRGHLRLVNAPRELVGLQPGVISNWRKINAPLEGVLPFMYTDAHDPPLVTTGMGNLVDPVELALALPWRNPDGSLADAATVAAQWQAVKDGPPNSSVNAGYLTTIRLDDAGIEQAIQTTLDANERVLREYFPTWDALPADVQACIMSMAWAMGPGFPATFTTFTSLINQGRFSDAIAQADFQGVGIAQRIAMNKAMLANGQIVADKGYDPTVLYWPGTPSASAWLTWKHVLLGVAGTVAAGGAGYLAIRHVRPDLIARLPHPHVLARLERLL